MIVLALLVDDPILERANLALQTRISQEHIRMIIEAVAIANDTIR